MFNQEMVQQTILLRKQFYTFAHLKRRLNDEKISKKMQKFG